MKYRDKKNKRGFTLIELIAVLVILAIIALIVTPLVMNIVKKAKDSANKRSVDAYGKAVELAIATYLLDTGDYPTSLDNLTVEYSGNEVICNVKDLNKDGSIYLSECSVKGTEVKDASTEDGWYHYGEDKNKTYQAYYFGDKIEFNGMNFYVIEDSDESKNYVTLLKETGLTKDELDLYGAGHVNVNIYFNTSHTNEAYPYSDGTGGMAYYSATDCNNHDYSNCIVDFDSSSVKYVLDQWSESFSSSLVELNNYKVRLLTLDELINNFKYEKFSTSSSSYTYIESSLTPTWFPTKEMEYWTMTYTGEGLKIYSYGNRYGSYGSSARIDSMEVYFHSPAVLPVINLKKSAIK